MIALVGVWDATGESRYRDAALDYALAAVEANRPTPATGDWKMGILADGLAATHAATGDDRLRRWLVDYAEALVAEPVRYQDPRFSLPLGYLAALTHEPRYAARARAAAAALKLSGWGKPLAAMGRTGFRLLAPLASADMAPPTSVPSRPSRPPPKAPRPRT
jgi:rhamnogalacturonyl hydrolase YesR